MHTELVNLEKGLDTFLARKPPPAAEAHARLLRAQAPLVLADLGHTLDCPTDLSSAGVSWFPCAWPCFSSRRPRTARPTRRRRSNR